MYVLDRDAHTPAFASRYCCGRSCAESAESAAHVHDYDEYMLVVQGCYTLIIDGKQIPVRAGEEYFIPRGVRHGGKVLAGTRTIHAFGGHRADRAQRPD